MNLKRNEKDTPDVNLTPLIDVVFLLLIFFMITSEFKDKSSLKFDLPQASPIPQKLQTRLALTIFIVPNGDIKFEVKKTSAKGKSKIKTFDNRSSKLAALKRTLDKLTNGNKKTRIYIQASDKSPFSSFVRIIDALKSLGLTKISIVTKQIVKPN